MRSRVASVVLSAIALSLFSAVSHAATWYYTVESVRITGGTYSTLVEHIRLDPRLASAGAAGVWIPTRAVASRTTPTAS